MVRFDGGSVVDAMDLYREALGAAKAPSPPAPVPQGGETAQRLYQETLAGPFEEETPEQVLARIPGERAGRPPPAAAGQGVPWMSDVGPGQPAGFGDPAFYANALNRGLTSLNPMDLPGLVYGAATGAAADVVERLGGSDTVSEALRRQQQVGYNMPGGQRHLMNLLEQSGVSPVLSREQMSVPAKLASAGIEMAVGGTSGAPARAAFGAGQRAQQALTQPTVGEAAKTILAGAPGAMAPAREVALNLAGGVGSEGAMMAGEALGAPEWLQPFLGVGGYAGGGAGLGQGLISPPAGEVSEGTKRRALQKAFEKSQLIPKPGSAMQRNLDEAAALTQETGAKFYPGAASADPRLREIHEYLWKREPEYSSRYAEHVLQARGNLDTWLNETLGRATPDQLNRLVEDARGAVEQVDQKVQTHVESVERARDEAQARLQPAVPLGVAERGDAARQAILRRKQEYEQGTKTYQGLREMEVNLEPYKDTPVPSGNLADLAEQLEADRAKYEFPTAMPQVVEFAKGLGPETTLQDLRDLRGRLNDDLANARAAARQGQKDSKLIGRLQQIDRAIGEQMDTVRSDLTQPVARLYDAYARAYKDYSDTFNRGYTAEAMARSPDPTLKHKVAGSDFFDVYLRPDSGNAATERAQEFFSKFGDDAQLTGAFRDEILEQAAPNPRQFLDSHRKLLSVTPGLRDIIQNAADTRDVSDKLSQVTAKKLGMMTQEEYKVLDKMAVRAPEQVLDPIISSRHDPGVLLSKLSQKLSPESMEAVQGAYRDRVRSRSLAPGGQPRAQELRKFLENGREQAMIRALWPRIERPNGSITNGPKVLNDYLRSLETLDRLPAPEDWKPPSLGEKSIQGTKSIMSLIAPQIRSGIWSTQRMNISPGWVALNVGSAAAIEALNRLTAHQVRKLMLDAVSDPDLANLLSARFNPNSIKGRRQAETILEGIANHPDFPGLPVRLLQAGTSQEE